MMNIYFSRIPSSVKNPRRQVRRVRLNKSIPNPWMMLLFGMLVGYILPLVLKAVFTK